ncbi:class I SAM-dependent methyltransferase [Angustibacter sp. McL0619]|uniref:class I SAM-dependent methyltransferase n=1 Tax=Angustibacter sp. McL0619 TaxID=3415676 RepID=UPI003CFA8CF7
MKQASTASRTAVLVCQGRAAAHGRLVPDRFTDPVAERFLTPDEVRVVEQVRRADPPSDWRQRTAYEQVRACADVVVPRTVAIDDAVRGRPHDQVVDLGAGLDTRAWRMPELSRATLFEVDHPASQSDKRERAGDAPVLAGRLELVPVDFTHDDLDAALHGAGHNGAAPTTWVWEGVVPYLTRAEVTATADVLARRSAAGSRLVVNYQEPGVGAALGRLLLRAVSRLAGSPDPLAGEPRRSSWSAQTMARLLADHGLVVRRDDDLLTLAEQLAMPVTQRGSLRNGRVAVADVS